MFSEVRNQKPTAMKKVLLSIIACALSTLIFAQSAAELISQGETLEKQRNESAALFKYKKAVTAEPNNFKAICKVSWLSSRVGFRVNDVNKKREYFESGMKHAEKAMALKPNSGEAHYLMAVSYGRMAQISSAKKRVAMLTDIKDHGTKCVQLDPKHAGGYFVLGRLNYRVANLNTAEKAAANIIFGGTPKGLTNEKAVAFYKKALSLKPTYILYWKDLALGYVKVKQKANAISALKKAIALPVQTEDDPGYKISCKAMLNKLEGK